MINHFGPFDLDNTDTDSMMEFENLVNDQVDERQEETCQDYGQTEEEY